MSTPLIFLLTILLFITKASCDIADYGSVPKGANPTLYDAADSVIQLDESTFNDTVFCAERAEQCPSYLVEFYSDWCGHCRAYAPIYKSLAKDIRDWSSVVKISAINCADPLNEVTCRANGIMFFPYIKYFPRNSSNANYSVKLRPYQSQAEMRDQITQVLVQDYAINHFEDWPTFDYLGDISTYGELWEGAKPSASAMVIIFESDHSSLVGAQLLLDLSKYSDRLVTRRCLKGHPLADALHINDFPTLAIFKRGERVPSLIAELRRLLLNELESFLRTESEDKAKGLTFGSRKSQHANSSAPTAIENICSREPEKCKALYYLSELDMLKAMRYALYREVSRTGGNLSGANLTALYTFVDMLASYFPYTTIDYSTSTLTSPDNGTESFLNASGRARVVFTHMRDFIEQKGLDKSISIEDWQAEFIKAEEDQGRPFPVTVDWEHCKGSSPQFRGYTCGLWSTFHALTVGAYRSSLANPAFKPIPVLHAIRDWVGSFFGCEHCRNHFLKMTTKTLRIEDQVHRNEDVFLYLWQAHNMVNGRLKGRETEDPQYPKFQFPAPFLCPECRRQDSHTEFDESVTQSYLVKYYTSIKPLSSSMLERSQI
ncbi:erv1 / alr family domain-containing protein [Ditylenchus destructor]|uniref:Sulfhydryl oxidase n=1 Tax=Ditylenchus destructor TaxID=166010 RepID=A0AAD4MQD5_9BILA|nr:erv1 / alr family domain-containing protein [Ditylenchus destructor]